MLEYSIIGKIYTYWQYSFIYTVLAKIVHVFSNAFSNSNIHRFLTSKGKMNEYCGNALITKALDAVIGFFQRLISLISDFLNPAWNSSGIVALFSGSVFVKFDFMLGAWIVLMFIVPHSLWSNSYAILAAFALFAIYFVKASCKKGKIVLPKEFGPAFYVFVIVTFTSNLYTTERGDSIRTTIFFVTAFIFLWLMRSAVDTRKKLEFILGCIYIVVIFTAIYAIGQRIVGIEVNPTFIDEQLNPNIPARVYSTVDNPNNYAELIVLFLPLSCVFAMNRKKLLSRFVLCCMLGLPAIALLMTYSRSGWLSIALCVFVFVYYTNRRLIPWILVAGLLCIPFLPASIITRLGNLVNTSDKSASFRLTLWESCLKLLSMDNRWLTGIGLGSKTYNHNLLLVTTKRIAEGMPHTQMLYMELFMGWGVMGFVSFMSFILAKIRDGACSIYKNNDALIKGTLISAVSSFLGIAILSIFEYIWFYPRILFAYFILLGLMLACIDLNKEKC